MVGTVLQSLRSLYKKQLHQYLKSFPAGKDVRSVMLSVLFRCTYGAKAGVLTRVVFEQMSCGGGRAPVGRLP